MNEEDKKTIEELLVLREKKLAFEEKKRALRLKSWGLMLFSIAVLAMSAMAVGFGGCCLKSLSDTLLTGSARDSVLQDNLQGNLKIKEKSLFFRFKGSPAQDKWPEVFVLLTNGVIVLAGLGTAAFTVRALTKNEHE